MKGSWYLLGCWISASISSHEITVANPVRFTTFD
jgi:hypothetical protein